MKTQSRARSREIVDAEFIANGATAASFRFSREALHRFAVSRRPERGKSSSTETAVTRYAHMVAFNCVCKRTLGRAGPTRHLDGQTNDVKDSPRIYDAAAAAAAAYVCKKEA